MPQNISNKKGAGQIFKELAPIVKRILKPHKKAIFAVAVFSLIVAKIEKGVYKKLYDFQFGGRVKNE